MIMGQKRKMKEQNNKMELIEEFKENIKAGKPLTKSAFYYLSDKSVQGLFEMEQSEEYKKCIYFNVEEDMLAIAKYIAEEHVDKKHIIFTDWGCGNGQISKIITHDLIKRGFDVTYMPVDISEKALQEATEEHCGEKVKSVLTLFENLGHIFPLSVPKNTVVVHGFLGNTVGNFEKDKINNIIKSVKEEVIVNMQVVKINNEQDKDKIIKAYLNKGMQKILLGPFELCGFEESDFEFDGAGYLRHRVKFEDGMIKTSVELAKDVSLEGVTIKAGTSYDTIESRRFTLDEFKDFMAPSCGDNVNMISKTGCIAVCEASKQEKTKTHEKLI